MIRNLLIASLFILSLGASHAATALSGAWQNDQTANVRLISATNAVGQDTSLSLGLEIQLADGWHTYWRSPGMAGLPPQLDWTNSQTDAGNLLDTTLFYPAPKRYTAYGLETIGYAGHVVFPIDAKLRKVGQAVNLDLALNLLVCSSICVPKHFALTLNVPEGQATPSTEADLIKIAKSQMPGDAETSGLLVKSIKNDGENLFITVESREALDNPDLFIENASNISFAAPVVKISHAGHRAEFKLKPADTLPENTKLEGMPITLTITSGAHALEQRVTTPTASAPDLQTPATPLPLRLAILFALIGGFILNLMPCVLPVLSIKILSVVSHGGGDKATVRRSFLTTAAGILFSFLALAAMTIALKYFGMTLGWGVQFQQPVFLVCLVILLTFFAANMWGLFEINPPAWLADNANKATYHPKLAGDFVTGAFATLLATPCTAPFLGTAIGFALASGPANILIIFAALGFGMIIPYLAIALFPSLATKMPKPGAWMIKLRIILGCALALTALWLLMVLGAQITSRFAAFVGLAMLGVVLLLALKRTSVSKRLVHIGLVVMTVVAIAVTFSGSMIPRAPAIADMLWLPFSGQAIAADIDEGKTVFVDVTADWCLTCKANKQIIKSDEALQQRLFHSDIIAMQADWTNPDPIIERFLQKYGRYGIPFNIVYGPAAPQGIVLPELLSPSLVIEALDKAQGRQPQP